MARLPLCGNLQMEGRDVIFHASPFPPSVSRRSHSLAVSAANLGNFSLDSIFKSCKTCGGKGAIECPGCKGSGKNKKNGNVFERWKIWNEELPQMREGRVDA
ncbi:PREDICTED: uncharacterized protein LOC104809734 isoform X2 [Tarenaya hassleriana]|uniref:uncharacterized protein LOC104809734 isoform X2 n=1 Tax=Tarenaya hassleriana TaxID=28532 RepID=UPI00053C8617|nr:PREDICTED: uncharacterized protein LOC104809734 isoform X2 [Tarenaya hassleriana]XP_010534104.1 PREDICTED: uncharacterized protein LOC104809734 isoform X2 [Tarenaya hassleriana]